MHQLLKIIPGVFRLGNNRTTMNYEVVLFQKEIDRNTVFLFEMDLKDLTIKNTTICPGNSLILLKENEQSFFALNDDGPSLFSIDIQETQINISQKMNDYFFKRIKSQNNNLVFFTKNQSHYGVYNYTEKKITTPLTTHQISMLINDYIYSYIEGKDIIRLNKEQAKIIWSYDISEFATPNISNNPYDIIYPKILKYLGVFEDKLLVHIYPHRLLAINNETGDLEWDFDFVKASGITHDFTRIPLFFDADNRCCHFLCGRYFFSFDLDTLKITAFFNQKIMTSTKDKPELWQSREALSLFNGLLYYEQLPFRDLKAKIGALDPKTGLDVWRYEIPVSHSMSGINNFQINSNYLTFCDGDENLYIFEKTHN